MIKAITASYSRHIVFKGNNGKFSNVEDNKSDILSKGEEIIIENQESLNKKLDSIDKKVNSIFTFLLETTNLKAQNLDLRQYVKDVGEKMHRENFKD